MRALLHLSGCFIAGYLAGMFYMFAIRYTGGLEGAMLELRKVMEVMGR